MARACVGHDARAPRRELGAKQPRIKLQQADTSHFRAKVMPQRNKEPKEAVIYAASKRKPPPFKPLRPSKVAKNVAVQPSGSSVTRRPIQTKATPNPARGAVLPDSDDEELTDDVNDGDQGANDRNVNDLTGVNSSITSEDGPSDNEDLPDLPPPAKLPVTKSKSSSSRPSKPPPAKKKSVREPSPLSVSSENSSPPLPAVAEDTAQPSQSDQIPSIPQPLLVRLLHEKFQDKTTQIDKHAIQVVQKYVEIFIREAIARTALVKREEAEKGAVGELEGKWLELEDLEKVAPGLMMDF